MPARSTRAVAATAVLLAACSGSEPDAPSIPDTGAAGSAGAVKLFEPGAEPRVRLGIVDTQPVAISVSATRRSEGSVGGERIEDTIGARYVLGIDLAAADDLGEYTARFDPVIGETTGFVHSRAPGSWEWRLTADGVLTQAEAPPSGDGDADRRLTQLLNAHALFLMVPSEPVGAGASWTFGAGGGTDAVAIRLDDIADDELTATVTFEQEQAGMRVASTATGTWLRRSLVARDVTVRVELSIAATTTRNGDEVEVVQSTVGELVYEADR